MHLIFAIVVLVLLAIAASLYFLRYRPALLAIPPEPQHLPSAPRHELEDDMEWREELDDWGAFDAATETWVLIPDVEDPYAGQRYPNEKAWKRHREAAVLAANRNMEVTAALYLAILAALYWGACALGWGWWFALPIAASIPLLIVVVAFLLMIAYEIEKRLPEWVNIALFVLLFGGGFIGAIALTLWLGPRLI